MAGVHKLLKSENHIGSLPGYQHYRECSCGWQCRVGTEVQADSQFKGHQMNNGYAEPTEAEKAEPKNTQEQAAAKTGGINKIGTFKPANVA